MKMINQCDEPNTQTSEMERDKKKQNMVTNVAQTSRDKKHIQKIEAMEQKWVYGRLGVARDIKNKIIRGRRVDKTDKHTKKDGRKGGVE
jgi:hypothetical protein